MTPHVVRSQGDMERLKQAEFARMSWCEADIFDVHGDVYPSTNMTVEMMDRENWDVVYPDVDPRGRPEPVSESSQQMDSPAPRNRLPGNSEVIPQPSELPPPQDQSARFDANSNMMRGTSNQLGVGTAFNNSPQAVMPASASFPQVPQVGGGR